MESDGRAEVGLSRFIGNEATGTAKNKGIVDM